MKVKKLVTAFFLVSAFSFVNVSCLDKQVKEGRIFTTTLSGSQEVPPNKSGAIGTAVLTLSSDEKTASVTYEVKGLTSSQTMAHIHGPAKPGVNAGVVFKLTGPDTGITLGSTELADLKSGFYYINVHSIDFPDGEIRGQLSQK